MTLHVGCNNMRMCLMLIDMCCNNMCMCLMLIDMYLLMC